MIFECTIWLLIIAIHSPIKPVKSNSLAIARQGTKPTSESIIMM